jgi:hypothetical protein
MDEGMVMIGPASERRGERDCEPAVAYPGGNATHYLENGYSVVGRRSIPDSIPGESGPREDRANR